MVRLLDKLLLFLECYFAIIAIYSPNNMPVVIRISCLDVKIFNPTKATLFAKQQVGVPLLLRDDEVQLANDFFFKIDMY